MADIAFGEALGHGLAAILPRRGAGADAVGQALGLDIVPGSRASVGGDLTLLGVGPNQWLAHAASIAPDWAERLDESLAEVAGVVDQSAAYVLFEIGGKDAWRLLQKGLPLDLAPAAFVPGMVAVSAIAHIGVIVHLQADGRFLVAVFRSFAESFRHWLQVSIAAMQADGAMA